LALDLDQLGGKLICQKDAFLAAAKGVSIGIAFQKRIVTGLFGGEGFIMQKLEGDGHVFVHAGGTLVERELKAGEELHVDTGCLAALSQTVAYDVVTVGGVKSMIFGGEGVFLAPCAVRATCGCRACRSRASRDESWRTWGRSAAAPTKAPRSARSATCCAAAERDGGHGRHRGCAIADESHSPNFFRRTILIKPAREKACARLAATSSNCGNRHERE
jgi:hypothetical protein